MRLTFVQLTAFATKWPRFGLDDEDLQSLESELIDSPAAGAVIPGTGGLRKLRFAACWHTGRRGALRVIYASIPAADFVYLFTLYRKNERSDLTGEERRVFRQVLERLQTHHQR